MLSKIFRQNKKGQLGGIQPAIMALVVGAIVLGVGLTVVQSIAEPLQQSGNITPGGPQNNAARLALDNSTVALGDLGDTWYTIIVTVVAAVVILGLIMKAFR